MDRPVGVTILAVITFVAGLVGLCVPIVLLITTTFGDAAINDDLAGVDGQLVFGASTLLLFIGPILYLVFSYGAFGLRRWAWWLGIFASSLSLVGNTIQLLTGEGVLQVAASTVFDLVIFVYLLMPHVRKAFLSDQQTTKPSTA